MTNTTNKLKFTAAAITTSEAHRIVTITVFDPNAETLETIKGLKFGDVSYGHELHDPFDNGIDDCHVSDRIHKFINVISADRKSACYILNFLRL